MTFSDAVERKIAVTFPEPSVNEVRAVLDPALGDRTLLAMLDLSDGDLRRLRHFSEVASVDFRDVIKWAECPGSDDEPDSYSELRPRLELPPEDS